MEKLNREILRAELTRDEGLRLKVYRCTAGKLTIGVGRNLDDVGIFPHETEKLKITKDSCIQKGITKEQAMALLDSDIDRCISDLDRRLPWWRTLDPVRQRVLINMCFNLGITGLTGFRNTLRMIQQGQYEAAARGMLNSLWARQVKSRANRLAELMRLGPKKL
jgi:lysozyme